MNKRKKPWYIWLSVFALFFFFLKIAWHYKFTKLFDGDNFDRWCRAEWVMVKTTIVYVFVPTALSYVVMSVVANAIYDGSVLIHVIPAIVFLVLYFSGVYATYRYSICKKKNLGLEPEIAESLVPEIQGEVSDTSSPGASTLKSRTKKRTIILIIAIPLAITLTGIAIALGAIAIIRNHPSYHAALCYIEMHPGVSALAGDITGFGFFPNGSISSVGGRGQADFVIRVNGSENTVRVHVQLTREPLREWEVVSFYYRK